MKKKIIRFAAFITIAVMLCGSACAGTSPRGAFKYAKNTLKCLASGDYDKIVALLPVSGISPDRQEWKKLAKGSFTSLSESSLQTRYAVAYTIGDRWRIAVPVTTPSHADVEVFFLDTEDCESFCGYGHSDWARTVSEYRSAKHVVWNEEYLGDSVSVESDNS